MTAKGNQGNKFNIRHDRHKIILTVDHISTAPEHVWLEKVGLQLPTKALIWQTVSIDCIELVSLCMY